jgi:hypothetical protein
MSKIRVTLDETPALLAPQADAESSTTLASVPQGKKIRVTLSAPEAVEPVPPKVMAFWNYDEDAHRADRPWRYQESPNEQAVREQAESDGAWTG